MRVGILTMQLMQCMQAGRESCGVAGGPAARARLKAALPATPVHVIAGSGSEHVRQPACAA
jgi:hypothetical protein